MARHVERDSGSDPTWDEAVAGFEAGQPAELARSPRTVAIEYRYADGRWWATSPELTGFALCASSLPEVKSLVADKLVAYLDPAVKLEEHVVEPATTRAAIGTFELHGAEVMTPPRTRSRVRAYIASRSLRVSA